MFMISKTNSLDPQAVIESSSVIYPKLRLATFASSKAAHQLGNSAASDLVFLLSFNINESRAVVPSALKSSSNVSEQRTLEPLR